LGVVVASALGIAEQLVNQMGAITTTGLAPGAAMQFVFTGLSSDIFTFMIPVLVTLPFTTSFLDDYQSRYYRSYLPRTGRGGYIKAKILAMR
jgi:hypothetical protein